MSLLRYRSKRDFLRTAEPQGTDRSPPDPAAEEILFVVQKHASRRLHYDFRLQIDGVLKSWAVPKGIPLEQGEKRLAMQVEDHPAEYGGFEGTIPSGQYGAGTVMLWDAGICQVRGPKPRDALRAGKLVLHLEGRKLKGHWSLIRMRPREDREETAWLLIKTEEDARPISTRADDRSALSERTMKQIASAASPIWQSDRKQRADRTRKRTVRPVRRKTLRRTRQRPSAPLGRGGSSR